MKKRWRLSSVPVTPKKPGIDLMLWWVGMGKGERFNLCWRSYYFYSGFENSPMLNVIRNMTLIIDLMLILIWYWYFNPIDHSMNSFSTQDLGPEGLRGRVMKSCRFLFTAVYTELFQWMVWPISISRQKTV